MEDQTKKPLEILVVEDKENYLKAAKEAAETTKHNIKYAINYEEGLKVLENEKVDRIITDVFFPGKTISAKEYYWNILKELNLVNDNYNRTLFNLREEPSGLLIAEYAMKKKIPFLFITDQDTHGQDMSILRNFLGWTLGGKYIYYEQREKKENLKKYAEHITYVPKEYPYILPIGGKYAIAKFGSVVIAGFFAWILKGFVELSYIVSIMPIKKALLIWIKGLRIFAQNDRLG